MQPRVWWVQYFGKRPDEVEGGYTGLHQDWTSWSQEVNGTADSALAAIIMIRSQLQCTRIALKTPLAIHCTAPNGFSGSGLFTCWVALSEVGPDSTPLQFVRGSHRWGVKYQDKATHRQDRATQRRKYACAPETDTRLKRVSASGTCAPLCQHGESTSYM